MTPDNIPQCIIGIAGLAGAGKDTVGYTLPERVFVRRNFADPLKRIAQDLFGFTIDHLWGASQLRNIPYPEWDGLTPRKALQVIGTDMARQLHRDVWVRAWGGSLPVDGTHVFVTDVRFPNELAAIADRGGFTAWIDRGTPRVLAHSHASERSIGPKDCHWTIDNTGTPAQAGQLLRQCIFSHYGLALGSVEE
jgi:hypothetical protein